MLIDNLDLNITPSHSCPVVFGGILMSHLATENQMFTGHLQPHDHTNNWALGLIRGTSASFNFAKAQTWARNTVTQRIERFKGPVHFRKLRPKLCWPYPDPRTHAPQPESMSKKLKFFNFSQVWGSGLRTNFLRTSAGQTLTPLGLTNLHHLNMTKEGNYGPCWLATVVHLAVPSARNKTSRTVKVTLAS